MHSGTNTFLAENQIKRCIEVINNLPIPDNKLNVLVTGGEPTLYPNLENIFNQLAELKALTHHSLYTNLSLPP